MSKVEMYNVTGINKRTGMPPEEQFDGPVNAENVFLMGAILMDSPDTLLLVEPVEQ